MAQIQRIEALPLRIPRSAIHDAIRDNTSDRLISEGVGGAAADGPRYRPGGPGRCVYPRDHEAFFVRVTTDDGHVGYGEALAPAVPEVLRPIVEELLSGVLVGRNPMDTQALWHEMYTSMRGRGHGSGFLLDAVTALDIALWDLKGKISGVPVWRMLGGLFREAVPIYVSGLNRKTADGRKDAAIEWAARGFRAFKGVPIDEIHDVQAAVGGNPRILVDALWRYSYSEAFEVAKQLGSLGVAAFECPVAPEALDDHRRLRDYGFVPIAIGEAERTRYEFQRILMAGAADILQPDIGRCGISEFMAIAAGAEAANREVAPHESMGLSCCIAASIHCAAAIPNLFMLEYKPISTAFAGTLTDQPFVVENGSFRIPEGPGLGVNLDWKRLEQWAI